MHASRSTKGEKQQYYSSNKSWSKALGISLVLECIQQLPNLCDLGECDRCLLLPLCLGLRDLDLDCLPLETRRLLWEPEEEECFHWLVEEERHSMGCSEEWLGLLSTLANLSRLNLAMKEAGIIWSQRHVKTHLLLKSQVTIHFSERRPQQLHNYYG